MAFDEHDYLEKTTDNRPTMKNLSSNNNNAEKSDRIYRKRDENDNEDDDRKRKISRWSDDDRRRCRDRERERERSIERRWRGKSKERESGWSNEREREREGSWSRRYEAYDSRGSESEREGSRSRRYESRGSESEKEREVTRSRRYGDQERELREAEIRDSDTRRLEVKKEAVEPEADPERDQRTVFAYQMPLMAVERDVQHFFSKAGKVKDVRPIMDRNSRRSKGDWYIEFYDVMSVSTAMAMSGQLFLGKPVIVKASEAEKDLVQSTASNGSSVTVPHGPTDRKLYVGNLHCSVTEQQLRQIFVAFGPIELVELPLNPGTGNCKGFGFVQFTQAEHAKQAQSLNGKLEIAGRFIKVSSVTEHLDAQEAGTTADNDGGDLALNASSRALPMTKLDHTGAVLSIAGSIDVPFNGSIPVQQPSPLPQSGQAVPKIPDHSLSPVFSEPFNGSIPVQQPSPLPQNCQAVPKIPDHSLSPVVSEPVGLPSECLLLKNLFDPATENDREFDLEIKEDVKEECSKFGRVRHIYVDKHSAGHVYLRYYKKEDATKAQQEMHMRWFGRRSAFASFMQPRDYEAMFPSGT